MLLLKPQAKRSAPSECGPRNLCTLNYDAPPLTIAVEARGNDLPPYFHSAQKCFYYFNENLHI